MAPTTLTPRSSRPSQAQAVAITQTTMNSSGNSGIRSQRLSPRSSSTSAMVPRPINAVSGCMPPPSVIESQKRTNR